jgi:hypothetical protein
MLLEHDNVKRYGGMAVLLNVAMDIERPLVSEE